MRLSLPGNLQPTMSRGLRGVISLLPVAVAVWMVRDSVEGDEYETKRKIAQNSFNSSFKALAVKQGKWSGYPKMEELSERLEVFKIYGPMDMIPKIKAWYLEMESLIETILLPNIIPITVAVASLYMGFGAKTLHAPFKAVSRGLRDTSIPASFKREFKAFVNESARGFGRLIRALCAMPFKSLYHFGFTLAGISLGAFFISRFKDVEEGQAQKRFFRTQIINLDERS